LLLFRRGKRAPTKALQSWLDEAMVEALEFVRRVPSGRLESSADYDEEQNYSHTRTFRFKASFRI